MQCILKILKIRNINLCGTQMLILRYREQRTADDKYVKSKLSSSLGFSLLGLPFKVDHYKFKSRFRFRN